MIDDGQGNALWLCAKLSELRKGPEFGQTQPMLAQAVSIAGPLTPHKQRFRTRETIVLPAAAPFDPSSLDPLVSPILQP